MFNVETIKTEMISMVGWRQNADPSGEQLLELTSSDSGLYFNDEHPMLTLENLYSIAPDFDQYEYPIFNPSKIDYMIGDVVKDVSDDLYYRLETSTVAQSLSSIYWKKFSPFTQWLREKTESGIIQSVNDWYSKKSKLATARNLLSRETIFQSGGDFDDLQSRSEKIVGQMIKPKNSNGMVLRISEISLQLSQNQDVLVKLFKKGTKTPIVEERLTYSNSGGIQWYKLTEPEKWELKGGEMYFIGYDETAITGSSINAVASMDRLFEYFPTPKYFNVQSFMVDGDFVSMWNESDVTYTTSTNFGLNYKVSVGCDYSDFIVDQKDLFKIIISKKVAMNLLRELIYNPSSNVNRHERNVDDKQLLYEIDGDSQSTPGNNRSLKEQYDSAIMAIQFDRTGIDKICLPCRKRGVKYGAVR